MNKFALAALMTAFLLCGCNEVPDNPEDDLTIDRMDGKFQNQLMILTSIPEICISSMRTLASLSGTMAIFTKQPMRAPHGENRIQARFYICIRSTLLMKMWALRQAMQ